MTCITIPNGIICISKTDFKCPSCDKLFTEKDYYSQLYKSKRGLIYKRCNCCGIRMGITTCIRGDVRVWDKRDEKKFNSVITSVDLKEIDQAKDVRHG